MLRKLFGAFVAFLVFIVFISLVVVGLMTFWPDYKDAGRIVNLIFLSIGFALAFWVYGKFINRDNGTSNDNEMDISETNNYVVENGTDSLKDDSFSSAYDDIIEKGKNYEERISFSEDKPKSASNTGVKIAIGLSSIVILAFIGLLAVGMFVSDDVANPAIFNDSNISFEYPSNWVRGDDAGYYLILEGDNANLYMNFSKAHGHSLDAITDDLISPSNEPGSKLLFKNSTTVNGVKAYDIGFYINRDGGFQARFLIFIVNDKYYIFSLTSENIEDENDSFNLVKNSIQVK